MPIPTTRSELITQLESAYGKLRKEIEAGGPRLGSLPCVDHWTVKQLLAVRAWWTASVVSWIDQWRHGDTPRLPAPGYRWKETPRLNNDIARCARRESYPSVCRRLDEGYAEVMGLIDRLSERELLDSGVFEGAGSYPVRRWLSLNTVRQYTTARTFIRRAVREADSDIR